MCTFSREHDENDSTAFVLYVAVLLICFENSKCWAERAIMMQLQFFRWKESSSTFHLSASQQNIVSQILRPCTPYIQYSATPDTANREDAHVYGDRRSNGKNLKRFSQMRTEKLACNSLVLYPVAFMLWDCVLVIFFVSQTFKIPCNLLQTPTSF